MFSQTFHRIVTTLRVKKNVNKKTVFVVLRIRREKHLVHHAVDKNVIPLPNKTFNEYNELPMNAHHRFVLSQSFNDKKIDKSNKIR